MVAINKLQSVACLGIVIVSFFAVLIRLSVTVLVLVEELSSPDPRLYWIWHTELINSIVPTLNDCEDCLNLYQKLMNSL